MDTTKTPGHTPTQETPFPTSDEIYAYALEYTGNLILNSHQRTQRHWGFTEGAAYVIKEIEPSYSQLKKENERLKEATHEREVLIKGFDAIRKEFEGRHWIMDGRGAYPFNDDRYKEEVRYIMDAFDKIKSEVWQQINSKSYEYKLFVAKELGVDLEQLKKDKAQAWNEYDKLQANNDSNVKRIQELVDLVTMYKDCVSNTGHSIDPLTAKTLYTAAEIVIAQHPTK